MKSTAQRIRNRVRWVIPELALLVSGIGILGADPRSLAAEDGIYPGSAAPVPDWLVEGLGAPQEYRRAQLAVDTAGNARPNSSNPTAVALSARVDGWRYVWHDGRWWYYQPNKQWLAYENEAWKPYAAPTAVTAQTAPASSSSSQPLPGTNTQQR